MYNLTRDLLELDPEAIRCERDDEGGGLYPLDSESRARAVRPISTGITSSTPLIWVRCLRVGNVPLNHCILPVRSGIMENHTHGPLISAVALGRRRTKSCVYELLDP